MVTFAQAQERAERWVNGEVAAQQHREVRVREFALGFVAWAEDREGGPATDGGRARLVIAREVVDEVLDNGTAAEAPPAGVPEGVTVPAGPGRLSVIGVLAVPPWRAGLEVSVLPEAYRDLLEVVADAGRPLRAAQIAAVAAGSFSCTSVTPPRPARDPANTRPH